MAACTTTYFDPRRGWSAQIAERNAELLAQQELRRRGVRTPEFYFTKQFDNSRLVKAPDPVRVREMRGFAAAVIVLFSLIMIYGLQHFNAIEIGYRVEAEKQTVEHLQEQNRQLRLSEAQLTQPARIDALAHKYGLGTPQPGQVVHPDATLPGAGQPVLAQAGPAPLAKAVPSF
jgi:cell division protein FtsL